MASSYGVQLPLPILKFWNAFNSRGKFGKPLSISKEKRWR
jgi:hypothetical protein